MLSDHTSSVEPRNVRSPVVLQALLEIVARHDGVQVARFRLIGQVLQLPEPAVVGLLIPREQFLQHGAGLDPGNGAIQRLLLRSERGERRFVVPGGLRIGLKLAVCVRHCQIRLLDRRVQEAAMAQLGPGRERCLIVAERRISQPSPSSALFEYAPSSRTRSSGTRALSG